MTCAGEKYCKFFLDQLNISAHNGDRKQFSIWLSFVKEKKVPLYNKKEMVEILLLAIRNGNNDAMLFYADMLQ